MDSDRISPSQKKIRAFLGMVLYDQHLIEGQAPFQASLTTEGQIKG